MRDPTTLAMLLAGGLLAILAVEAAVRRTLWGVGAVAVLVGIEATGLLLETTVAGFRVEPSEVLALLLGVAAVARLARGARLGGAQVLLLALLGLTLLAIVKGMEPYGLGAAVNESRKFLRYGAVALYVSTVVPTDDLRDGIGLVWVRLGVVMLAVALVRWVAFFGGVELPFSGAPDDLRVVDSFRTLILLQAFLLAAGAVAAVRLADGRGMPTTLDARTFRRLQLFAPTAFVAIVLLQHRTLWVAGIIGIVGLVARDPRVGRRLLARVVAGGVLVGVVAFLLLGQGQDTIVLDRLQGSATDVDTFGWRVAGWAQLVEDQAPGDFEEVVVGQAFGRGYPRFVDGGIVDVTPHNFFLETFLRLGLAGVAILVVLHGWLILRLYRSRRGTALLRDDVLAIALTLAVVYYLTSHPQMEQAILLGAAIAAAQRPGAGSPPRGPDATAAPARVADSPTTAGERAPESDGVAGSRATAGQRARSAYGAADGSG